MKTLLKKNIGEGDNKEIEHLKLFFENSPTAMFLHVGEKFVFVNNKAEQISGYAKHELLDMKFWELVHPENRDMVITYGKERLKGSSIPNEYTIKLVTKTRETVFADITVSCVDYFGDKAVLGSVVDVTSRVNAERTWKTFFEFAPVGFFVIDQYGNMIDFNQEIENIFGYKRDDLVGVNLLSVDLIFEADKNKILKILQKSINGETVCPEDIGIRKPDGMTGEIEIRTYPLNLNGERVILGCVSDTSLKKCAKLEFQKAAEKLKELNSLRSKFISKVSHEFRTPLATILSSVELLELFNDNITCDEKKEHFKKIIFSIDYLTQLLNDVITINDADCGLFQVNRGNFDIVEFTRDLKDEIIQKHKSQKNIKFISNSGKFIVNTDKNLIRQIISNLVENAVKYTDGSKNIFLSLKCNAKSFIIVVEDEGLGIPENALKNIFTPFFRANNTGRISGAGLGLAIVKRSVELLNGEIDFISKINRGTKFIVKFPS